MYTGKPIDLDNLMSANSNYDIDHIYPRHFVKDDNINIIQFPSIIFYAMPNQKVKLAAGWLIEQCGWKGKIDGNVAVWKNQALVLTNLGQAKGSEIYNTSSKIMNDVQKKFGISLEREVNIL